MSRIANLPRRVWQDTAEQRAQELTEILRTPQGTMALRPAQGQAIWEAYEMGGLFAALRVGAGKTIISALVFEVLASKRPLLIVPAKLVKKTKAEFAELRRHWNFPQNIHVISYEKVSQPKNPKIIEELRPDVIVADEAHKLKNISTAACARRIGAWLTNQPQTKFIALSGTIAKNSIKDYAHIVNFALRENSPLPRTPAVIEEWSQALDVGVAGWDRPDYKILWQHIGRCNSLDEAREAYCQRLESAPGVIISTEGFEGSNLVIRPMRIKQPAEFADTWTKLRELWLNPFDEYPLGDAGSQGGQVWMAARQLELGFCKYHDPWPPKPWMDARRAWAALCREVIETSDGLYDTECMVRDAFARGEMHSPIYDEWCAIEPTFTVTRKTKWLSNHAIEQVAKSVKDKMAYLVKHGAIVWVDFPDFARKLAEHTGWPYYGAGGICKKSGLPIESEDGSRIIIASRAANDTGRNLQMFFNNFVVGPPPGGPTWEQMLGRTHRDGQKSDCVNVWYFVGCKEDLSTMDKALRDAAFTMQTTRAPQKLAVSGFERPDWTMTGPEYD